MASKKSCQTYSIRLTFNEFSACTTAFFDSFRYFKTASFPPPGLYSEERNEKEATLVYFAKTSPLKRMEPTGNAPPNCEMKAMLFEIAMALFQSSAASKNVSRSTLSMYFTLLNTCEREIQSVNDENSVIRSWNDWLYTDLLVRASSAHPPSQSERADRSWTEGQGLVEWVRRRVCIPLHSHGKRSSLVRSCPRGIEFAGSPF